MTLSKSDYISFLVHPAYLWLKKYEKHKLPPVDEATQDIFDAGNLFESYVEKLFPEAVKIGFDRNNFDTYKKMLKKTADEINYGTKVILQGRLEANNTTCIFDILKRVEGITFDLIEIKSSSSEKPEHSYDLAFQKQVLENTGLKIRKTSVIHLNKDYIKKGEIDIKKLIIGKDVTEEVNSLKEITKQQTQEALNILENTKCPDLSPRYINQLQVVGTKWKDYWMETFLYINKKLPKYSIYKLCRLDPELIAQWEDSKIEEIKDIPEDTENLHPRQINQILTTKYDKQIIEKEKIEKFIDTLEYPLYFFDYETFASIIPLFDGTKPYQPYPFQYSLHILDSLDAEVRHTEYLHTEKSDPMPNLIEKMKKDLGDKGTILTWNMNYEIGCNKNMIEAYPEHTDYLLGINERIKDLMTPFSKQWFVDKNFFGSASIKKVLPVLAPEHNYKDLNVSDGMQARRTWIPTVLEDRNTWNKDEVLKDLRDYCKLDTYAMVLIYKFLYDIKETEFFYSSHYGSADPVENTKKFIELEEEVFKEAQKNLAERGIHPGMGYIWSVWDESKKIFKDKHGIDWKTPGELNPGLIID